MVTASQVLGYVEKTFVKKLVSAINKEIKTIRERRFVHVLEHCGTSVHKPYHRHAVKTAACSPKTAWKQG